VSSEAREDSSILHLVRPTPRRIGRYDICFEIAAGGMATIYLARVEGPGGFKKLVALKCIHPHLVRQAGFVEMFLDEARLASRISHPNVCSVFDFGFADSTYYIAMEFLVGETVGRLCRLSQQHPEASPMPLHAGYAARVIADAAEGLHAAHMLYGDDGQLLNVVHRDVSPQNVMVTYDGAVKITDFGIARTVDQLHLTRTGTVRGKFPYMAPEQVEQGPIDHRADVWSLGVVFWELLTGAQLFHREREVDSIRAVLQAPIPAPSAARPGVPREFDEIVMHALQRDPARRFATARDLSLAIENVRGRREATVGHGMLAAWLRQLFPDLYARRLELVDQARQMDEGSVPRISRALSEPTVDTRRVIELPKDTGSMPAPAPWRRRAAIASLLALVAAAVAYGVWPPREADEQRVAREPSKVGVAADPDHEVAAREHPRAGAAAPSAAGDAPLAATAVAEAGARDRSDGAPEETTPPSPTSEQVLTAGPDSSEPARRAAGRGFVNVATPGGWADVFAAGKRQGRTPLQLEIRSGRRTLVLRPFGKGKPIRRVVLVRRNQLTRVVVPID
jgi:serine/threonine-protein kinase